MAHKQTLIIGLLAILAMAWFAVPGQAAPPAAKDTETPTPTQSSGQVNPTATATARPTALPTALPTAVEILPTAEPLDETPTPWVVIMVTPTAIWPAHPPSLTITDLDKKIKDKKAKGQAAGAGGMLFMPNRILAPLQADNPVPSAVDDAIGISMAYLIQQELDYYHLAGQFAQMMPTHGTPPADSYQTYPDGWFNHPSDQPFDWAALAAIRFEPLPFAIQIDTYNGPLGAGFVVCYRMGIDGQTWKRCLTYGSDASGRQEWQAEK